MKFQVLSAFVLLSQVLFAAETTTASKYFIVQNIATEKMRIYERCTTSSDCPHRMVFQTDMVVGKLSGDKDLWTRVGTYKVEKWVKFYEDGGKQYPSWFDPNYPATPAAGQSFGAWTDKTALPGGHGSMRGAFGWYAAMLAPNPHGQWIHGTIGWGSDEDRYIKQTRGFLANVFADPRSHGCTRLENRAVAFVQSFITPGTEVYRVYALEAYADKDLTRYQSQQEKIKFDFILTKDQVRKDNPNSIAKPSVELRLRDGKITSQDVLEEGSYLANQYPQALGLSRKRASSGKSGDTYSLGESSFKGAFLVDEGRFVNYDHPSNMPRGGVLADHAVLPESLKAKAVTPVMAEVPAEISTVNATEERLP